MNANHSDACTMINQEIIVTQPSEPVIANFDMNKDTIYLDQSENKCLTIYQLEVHLIYGILVMVIHLLIIIQFLITVQGVYQ